MQTTFKYSPWAAVGAAAALAATAFAESFRQRRLRQDAEDCLRLYAMAELEEGIYQTCPDCSGEGRGCSTCWDVGLIAHQEHDGDEDEY